MDVQPDPGADGVTGGTTRVGDVPQQRGPSDRPTALTPLVPTGPPVRRPRRSRWRTALAVVLAAFPLLCVVAIPFAFHSYDTATRPDRSAPDVAVHNYLQAYLVDRDDAAANQFVCAAGPRSPDSAVAKLVPLAMLRSVIESGEQRTGKTVSFTWVEGAVVSNGPDAATIDVRIVSTVGGVSAGGSESDEFSLATQLRGQWCVASATKLD